MSYLPAGKDGTVASNWQATPPTNAGTHSVKAVLTSTQTDIYAQPAVGTYTINKKTAAVNLTATKAYDGSDNLTIGKLSATTINNTISVDILKEDALTITVLSADSHFANANVGTGVATVTATWDPLASNYYITLVVTGAITPKAIADAAQIATVEKTGSTTLALSELMTATGFVTVNGVAETIDTLAGTWEYAPLTGKYTSATGATATFYVESAVAGTYEKVKEALAAGKTYYVDLAVATGGFGANYNVDPAITEHGSAPVAGTLGTYIKVELKQSSGGVPDSPGGGGTVTPPAVTEFEVTFAPGARGTIASGATTVLVKKGESVTATPTVAPEVGFMFKGWSTDGTNTVDPTTVKITAATTFTALYTENNLEFNEGLKTPYIQGYTDGTFGPQKSITRAEVSAIIARTLNRQMQEGKIYANTFTDVSADKWYANEVGFLAQFGVITGYQDNSFRAENVMSRAEFMSMIIKVDGLMSGTNNFSDVNDSFWGEKYITSGVMKKIIDGYVDGTFKPDASITRAEVVKIMNVVLARSAQSGNSQFPDVPTTHWAHDQINAASK